MSDFKDQKVDERDAPKGVSRRDFVKSFGVLAATAALGGIAPKSRAQEKEKNAEDQIQKLGPAAFPVHFTLNGKTTKADIEPRVTLSSLLRHRLGLTGTKEACERGACGSCTVIIDGTTRAACMTLAADLEGADITTVEGIGRSPHHLHPIQEKFVEHDALQCGYCTPGMTVACFALLQRNHDPSEGDIREAVSGNICRCGTYNKVFSATLDAARELRRSRQPAEGGR